MFGNAPISVYARSKDLTRYRVSIKSTSHSSVVFGAMGCEPLTASNFCPGTLVVARTHKALEAVH